MIKKKKPCTGCWEGLAEMRIPPAHVADLLAWRETTNALNFLFMLPVLRGI